MGNPIFRFTLSNQPDALPPLSDWIAQPGSNPWTAGSAPSVTLLGVSDYLYIDYPFSSGGFYSITVAYTKVYNSGSSNPRNLKIAILDDSFSVQFITSGTTPPSPGGTGSVNIQFTANAANKKIALQAEDGSNITMTINEAEIDGSSLEITEPGGWIDAKLKLERHEEFHSLIEYFKGTFTFYGNNGVDDGGLDYIRDLERSFGPDVTILIDIDVSFDSGKTYEDIFSGQLDLSAISEAFNNQAEIPIIRDDFWAKFISRKETPVDLQAIEDLDGETIVPIDPVTITLTTQKIQKKYIGELANQFPGNEAIANTEWVIGDFVQIDMDTEILSEITEKYHIPTASNPELPVGLFFMEEGGEYEFDIRIEASATNNLGDNYSLIGYLVMYIKIGNDAPIAFAETDFGPALSESTVFTYADNINIPAGSNVVIYGEMIADISVHGGSTFFMIWPSDFATTPSGAGKSQGTLRATHLYVTGQTIFPDNRAESFLLHDAFAATLKPYALGEDNPFYSDLLGSQLTNARTYEVDGCAWKYIVLKGLQLRRYALEDKPFFTSFDQCWKGANPILNLGLTYDLLEADNGEEPVTDFPDLSDFTNNGSGDAWSVSMTPSVNVVSGASARYRSPIYAFEVGYRYVVTIDYNKVYNSGSGIVHEITLRVTEAGGASIESETVDTGTGSDSGTLTLDFTVDTIFMERITVEVDDQSDVTVTIQNLTIVRYPSDIQQLLLNPDFTSGSNWTNQDSGTDWVITGDEATLTLPSGTSKNLVQTFLGAKAGDYNIISRRVSTNFNAPTDSVNFVINVYDADDNPITGVVDFTTGNNTIDVIYAFTTVVPLAKIKIIAAFNTGSDIDIAVPYLYLFGPTDTPLILSQRIIRIEEKSFFYDPTISVNISNVLDITREYDNDLIFNKVEIGNANWQSEDISGIDDPQTKHTYATRFKKIGKSITLYSEFIAASLAIETTRRQTIEKSKDYKFDNNTFIIAINEDNISPDSYIPELDENFDSITNLLNPDTRYNSRLTPARALLRWLNYLNGALQSYLSSFYKFVGGEGNYDMASQMNVSDGTPDLDCLNESFDDQSLSEKQDIPVTDEYLHLPLLYTININLSWDEYEEIRDNRTKAIGISQTEIGHVPFFIKDLEYELCASKCTIKAWPLNYFEIQQIDFVPRIVEPITGCGFGDMDRATSDGEGRITSDGECRVIA